MRRTGCAAVVTGLVLAVSAGLAPSAGADVVARGDVLASAAWAGGRVVWVQHRGGRDDVLVGGPGIQAAAVTSFPHAASAQYFVSASASHVAVRRLRLATDPSEVFAAEAEVRAGPAGGPLRTVAHCGGGMSAIGVPDIALSGSGLAIANPACGLDLDEPVELIDLTTNQTRALGAFDLQALQGAGPYIALGTFEASGTRVRVLDGRTGAPVYIVAVGGVPITGFEFALHPSGAVTAASGVAQCQQFGHATPDHPQPVPVPGLACATLVGAPIADGLVLAQPYGPVPMRLVDLAGATVVDRMPAGGDFAISGRQAAYAVPSCYDRVLRVAALPVLPGSPRAGSCVPRVARPARIASGRLRLRLRCPHGCGGDLFARLRVRGRHRVRSVHVDGTTFRRPPGRRALSLALSARQVRLACRTGTRLRLDLTVLTHQTRPVRFHGRRRAIPISPRGCTR